MIIYHWTTHKIANKAIAENCLNKRNWKHYIEKENDFFSGTSWGLDFEKWKANHSVCFEIDTKDLINTHHLINGNKVFLRTQGIINDVFDPEAWRFESDYIDECFIVGNIKNFNVIAKRVY
jgi:hypothetical protein